MRTLYPMMADIAGRPCLIVGGGTVAERKAAGLLDAGAAVTVVSPDVTPRIAAWAAEGRLSHISRAYESADGEGMALVFAATDRPDVNERVHADATSRGQPVNVADRPELCSFVVPAVWRRGHLLVAVSTSGTSPMASARIRDRIEAAIGDGIDAFLEFADEYRRLVQARVPDPARRKELLGRLFADEALELVRAGRWDSMRARLLAGLEGGTRMPSAARSGEEREGGEALAQPDTEGSE
ncbi:precorrin-2 dehydrogenase/sirohydrochlorin ferrochelatase family protein [Paenibacillus flagellatus]|uniref:precorrin-2 dehydrogenase n=1 Tax=Paenibacillus flagellatus TaxID=2211139 RepID=A0A2V5JZC9_9BACL|nr:bifunctional precorrin-2 dehydrogenase/sirohydrochlorin ferrochelatase [Paenibacillus flagellatus]PYI52208.1 siroheme synthase [Paenibacillus flagellatus]